MPDMPDEPSRRAEAAPPPEPVESTPNGGEAAAKRPPAPNPPLIRAVEIENFKGIGRPMRVELRPVTLLFGNNSAGKSTVLQALCYAHEILSRGNVDAHATELGGDRIDLGGFRNFVHAHDTTRAVRLRIELNLEAWDDVPKPVLDSLVFDYGNATFEWGPYGRDGGGHVGVGRVAGRTARRTAGPLPRRRQRSARRASS